MTHATNQPPEAEEEGVDPPPSDLCPRASGPPKGWVAFEVGEDLTQNKKLMEFLAERRSKGKNIPLEEVKAELGIR